MGSKGQQPDPSGTTVDSLLKAAKSFLTYRNFEKCRICASKALEANPNHPGPAQLLAITSILSVCPASVTQTEPPPDWYAVLDLPRFTNDLKAIRARFDHLYGLVNPYPKRNPYPFADEAREWILKAGEVLGDPDLKAQFDNGLRTGRKDARKVSGPGGDPGCGARQDGHQKRKPENCNVVEIHLTEDDGKEAGEEMKNRRKKENAAGKKKIMGKGFRVKWHPRFFAMVEGGVKKKQRK